MNKKLNEYRKHIKTIIIKYNTKACYVHLNNCEQLHDQQARATPHTPNTPTKKTSK